MGSKTLCIYHGSCADGFGAAWAVRHGLGDGNVEFHHGVYGHAPPDVKGRDVVIVDFSYPYDVLIGMSWKANSVLIIDHHKSAAGDLARLPPVLCDLPKDVAPIDHFHGHFRSYYAMENFPCIGTVFDMNKSGAMLAWEFFNPGRQPPKLLQHIQDRDLWRFELPFTREISACLFSYPYDFDLWDRLMEEDPQKLANDGAAIERKHFKDINELIASSQHWMTIAGLRVPVLNAPIFYSSDAGHIMSRGQQFAACYWFTADGVVFSLRSNDGGLDVSEIAKQYGGGGHRNAAGFRVSREQFEEFKL